VTALETGRVSDGVPVKTRSYVESAGRSQRASWWRASVDAEASWLLPALGLLIAGVIWEFIARVVVANPLLFAPLTATLAALWNLIATGTIFPDLLVSSEEFFIGYILAAISGLLIGSIFAAWPAIGRMFSGVVQGLYSTPLVAVAPLFVVLFGIGIYSKAVMVFVLAIFPVLISTESAFRSIDPDFVETALAFGASKRQLIHRVVLPAALAGVVNGLRLAVGRGIIGVVVGEIFGATAGLGFLIVQYSQAFQTARTLAVVLVLALIGIVSNSLLRLLERRLSPWARTSALEGLGR
jgi:ABC-type nitrate/sulfonate/bicarbonate transport system permease component